MSCERYFIELPPQEPLTPESLLEESLALVYPKDILLHSTVFFVPFEPMMLVKTEKKRLWSRNQRKFEYNPATVLRNNIRFMISKTKHFGLLLSQLTWVGLLNLAEKRSVLQHFDHDLRAAALYIIMLKKEANGMTQFINCLHMTGNHEIANVIEAKLELLVENIGNCELYDGHCTSDDRFESCEEWHRNYLPPKKRKTSADSGFDDSDDDAEMESSFAAAAAAAAISSMNGYARRKFRCNIRPLDAVDVIAIINGKEDSRSKVELCKCGNYHQYPKWKDVNSTHASITKENSFMMKSDNGLGYSTSASSTLSSSSIASGFAKYFSKRRDSSTSFNNSNALTETENNCKQQQKQGILSSVSLSQPVEVGLDLSHGMPDNLEFTKPRRSCSHRKLRFSSHNSFAEHPDNIQAVADDGMSEGEEEEEDSKELNGNVDSLVSKLPRFLRLFL